MTSVLHHKAKVQVSCEVQGKLDLSDVADVHRVWRIGTQTAIGIVREHVWREA